MAQIYFGCSDNKITCCKQTQSKQEIPKHMKLTFLAMVSLLELPDKFLTS